MQSRNAVAVIALLAVSACQQDKPTQPVQASKTVARAQAGDSVAAVAQHRAALVQGALSFTDSSTGVTYTYQPTTHTISDGTRSVIIEDDSLAGGVFTEFTGTAMTDVQINALYGAATGSGGGGRIKPIPTVDRHHGQLPPLPLVRLVGSRTRPFVRPTGFEGWGVTIPTEFGVGFGMPVEAGYFQGLNVTCTSLANDVVIQYADWRNSQRGGFVHDLFSAAFEATTEFIFDLPLGSTLIADNLAENVANRQKARISTGVMGAVWNSLGCNSSPVQATEALVYGGTSGGGSSGGSSPSCSNEEWAISFDNGQTWSYIYVWTCYVKSD